jgi:hypothetical protein
MAPHVPRDEFDTETPTGVRVLRVLEARVQRLEMRDANMFGIEGNEDGQWQRHKKEHEAMREVVNKLDAFKGKAMLLVTLGGSALGIIAGFAAVLVEKAFH